MPHALCAGSTDIRRPPNLVRRAARASPHRRHVPHKNRSGLDPAKWMDDMLRKLPTATTATLNDPLPSNWKPAAA